MRRRSLVVETIGTMIMSTVLLGFANALLGWDLSTGQTFLMGAGITAAVVVVQLTVDVARQDRRINLVKGVNSLAGTVGALAFAVVLVWAAFHVRAGQQPFPDGVVTTATLSSNADGGRYTTATYTFTTRDGQEISFDDPISAGDQPDVGTTAEVSYRPSAPGDARLVRGWSGWTFFPVVILAFGILLPTVLIVSAVRRLRSTRADA